MTNRLKYVVGYNKCKYATKIYLISTLTALITVTLKQICSDI